MVMRKLLMSLFALCMTGLLVNPVDAIDPIGLWRMDDGAGNVVKDSSGNNRDGETKGDPQWVNGKIGMAL